MVVWMLYVEYYSNMECQRYWYVHWCHWLLLLSNFSYCFVQLALQTTLERQQNTEETRGIRYQPQRLAVYRSADPDRRHRRVFFRHGPLLADAYRRRGRRTGARQLRMVRKNVP